MDDDTLVGKNVLGGLLMVLRERLLGADCDSLRVVQPLEIPAFMLFGQPIGEVRPPTRRLSAPPLRAAPTLPAASQGSEPHAPGSADQPADALVQRTLFEGIE